MRSVFIAIFILLIAISCRDKVICPAFQSTYILDDSTRLAYYSYAWKLDDQTRQQYLTTLPTSTTDTTSAEDPMMRYYAYAEQFVPPPEQVRKTKFGIVKYEPYWLKNYKLRTAPKENVLGPGPLKVEEEIDVGEFVASDFVSDSLVSDSVNLVAENSTALGSNDSLAIADQDSLSTDGELLAKKEEKKEPKYLYRYDPSDDFNVEQEYYNKYFGEKFIDNRPDPEPKEMPVDSVTGSDQKKGGFLSGLFGKRKSAVSDTTSVENEQIPIEEPVETTEEQTNDQNDNEQSGEGQEGNGN